MRTMSQVIDWVEKTNAEIIDLVLNALEQNKSGLEVFNEVRGLQLSDDTISVMVENDIQDVLKKWNKYYDYGYIPIADVQYAETSALMNSRTSIVSKALATSASNSFANLTSQMFNLTENGSISRKQAISILRKKYVGNTITYANGRDVPIKDYLDMVFRTELSNVTRQRAFEVGNELGTDVYEMSTKADSAERCVNAQGGYINFGLGDMSVEFKTPSGLKSFDVRDVVLHDRYGQADALGGIGCRHTWVPRVPGFSTTTTQVRNAEFFHGL